MADLVLMYYEATHVATAAIIVTVVVMDLGPRAARLARLLGRAAYRAFRRAAHAAAPFAARLRWPARKHFADAATQTAVRVRARAQQAPVPPPALPPEQPAIAVADATTQTARPLAVPKPKRPPSALALPDKRLVAEQLTCVICLFSERTAAFACGHACACAPCAKQLEFCPLCRRETRGKFKKIFLS